ncbi:hypothetical protein KR009_007396 [Drosophila setifemur]|nr:hypothetical protein KR009_007396 [Drosophila setifemur]
MGLSGNINEIGNLNTSDNQSRKLLSWRRFVLVMPQSIVLPNAPEGLIPSPEDMNSLYLVQSRLQEDLLGCEAMWTLFVTAALSYRFESRLRPFPRSCSNIDRVWQVVEDVPRIEILHQQLMHCDYNSCTSSVIGLLSEVLVDQGDRVFLSSLRTCEFQDLYSHLGMPPPRRQPTQVFEIRTGRGNSRANAYAHLRKQNKGSVRMGFLGCQLETLYALLNDDPLPEGESLELTSDVNEALDNTRAQAGVGGSRCGSILRCVAMVEFVLQGNETSADKKHVLVRDGETMQVTYLMLYGQSCKEHEAEMELKVQPVGKLIRKIDDYELSLGISLLIVSSMAHFGSGFFRHFAQTGFHILKRGLL